MAQVTLTGPNVDDDLDPEVMRAVLQVIVDGVNNIDQTQLGGDSVGPDQLQGDTVSQTSLKPGVWVRYGTIRDDQGGAPDAAGKLALDGTSGALKGARLVSGSWRAFANPTYELRDAAGDDLVLTAQRPSLAFVFGVASVNLTADTFTALEFGIWDKAKNGDYAAGLIAHRIIKPDGDGPYALSMFGVRELNTGESVNPKLAIKLTGTGTLGCDIWCNPNRNFVGVLMLPK